MEGTLLNTVVTSLGVIVAAVITAAAMLRAAKLQSREVAETSERPQAEPVAQKQPPRAVSAEAPAKSRRYLEAGLVHGVVLTLLSAVGFAAHSVLARHLIISDIHPLMLLFCRNLASGLLILLVAMVARHFAVDKTYTVPFTGDSMLMVLSRALGGVLYLSALLYLTATAGLALFKLNAVWTLILLLFLLRRRLDFSLIMNSVIGVSVASLGVVLVVQDSLAGSGGVGTAVWPGVALAVGAGLAWAVFAVGAERHGTKMEKARLWERQFHLGRIYLLVATLSLVVLVMFAAAWSSFAEVFVLSGSDIFKAGILGVFSGGAVLLYYEAIKRVSVLLVTTLVSLELLITMVFERVFLAQDFAWYMLHGTLLIILGAISISRENVRLRLTRAEAGQ